MFVTLKLCVGFSILDSVSFSLKIIFLFNKMHVLFDFIISFKIKIIEKPHIVLLLDFRFLNSSEKF